MKSGFIHIISSQSLYQDAKLSKMNILKHRILGTKKHKIFDNSHLFRNLRRFVRWCRLKDFIFVILNLSVIFQSKTGKDFFDDKKNYISFDSVNALVFMRNEAKIC
jgi:hypothetical protein